jgi:uncharacterized protein
VSPRHDLAGNPLDLADWRRQVSEIYGRVRAAADPQVGWEIWRAEKSRLYRMHPQSPAAQAGRALATFAYDPAWRRLGHFEPCPPVLAAAEPVPLLRIGTVRFTLPAGDEAALVVLWPDDYGGGLFLPFRDATNGSSTYGGGRYLLDGAKGADLGTEDGALVLDFNFAYHPSCVHDARWVCPLAPPANRLAVDVAAGERLGEGQSP